MIYFCSTVGTTYTREARVDEVSNGWTTFVDDNGEGWDYYTTDYTMGEKVVMVMDTNGTDNDITDDVILEIK